MKKYSLLFLSFFYNIKANFLSFENNVNDFNLVLSSAVSPLKVTFYEMGKKVLIPNITINKSFKYAEFYCLGTNGFDLYFINRKDFRFGIFSLRLDFFNTILDTILIHNTTEVSCFKCFTFPDNNFAHTLAKALINNIVFSLINIKISAFTIHFLETNVGSLIEGIYMSKLTKGVPLYDMYSKRIRRYLILTWFAPSLQIDILKLVDKLKGRRLF